MKNEDELSEEEIRSLRDAKYFLNSSMEDRIVKRLGREGLLERRMNYSRTLTVTGLAVIFVVVFIAGFFYGRAETRKQFEFNYVLLLHQTNNFDKTTSASEKFSEYGEWTREIKSRGVKITGEKLSDPIRLIANLSIVKADTTNQNNVSGYFLLHSQSESDVISIAENSPHVKYGGIVEIRKIANQ